MSCFPSYFAGGGYALLQTPGHGEENLETALKRDEAKGWSTKHVLLLCLSCVLFAGGLGSYVGMQLSYSQTDPKGDFALLTPAGDVERLSLYNRTFTEPGPESDAAWDSMFPLGVGFVRHPQISPKLSGLAVFHQLHCVNMLRVGYYAAIDGTLADKQHIHDHNRRPDPHHVRHCFDYLRQALMCAADTNLEPVDFELGGTTGWGVSRTCRNFDAVKEWSGQWSSWDSSIKRPDK
ncbi:hypothetical protein MMC16_006707 [Acarospora aff. strigata]|nr:hypothetical protein [Acarospora aff. strigata]